MTLTFFNKESYGPFINDKFIQGQLKEQCSIALNKPWTKLSHATDADIQDALNSSEQGNVALQNLSARERSTILNP